MQQSPDLSYHITKNWFYTACTSAALIALYARFWHFSFDSIFDFQRGLEVLPIAIYGFVVLSMTSMPALLLAMAIFPSIQKLQFPPHLVRCITALVLTSLIGFTAIAANRYVSGPYGVDPEYLLIVSLIVFSATFLFLNDDAFISLMSRDEDLEV